MGNYSDRPTVGEFGQVRQLQKAGIEGHQGKCLQTLGRRKADRTVAGEGAALGLPTLVF